MRGIGGRMGSITPQQNVEATMVVSFYDVKQKRAHLTRNRSGHPKQQRQQEPESGAERHQQDVQAVAEVLNNYLISMINKPQHST
jgi:hypothetical protein